MAVASTYPLDIQLNAPLEVARWRPLVHWFLVIPHWIVLYVLGIVASVLAFISWFAILSPRTIPTCSSTSTRLSA